MPKFQTILALGAALSTAACATVTRGTTEDIVINYSPSDANVTTSLNHTCNSNPCVVKVPRKESFTVTVSKPGFETRTVAVGTKVSRKGAAGIAGNILVGGLVGVGVDAATGAGRDHYPNPVNVDLLPRGSVGTVEPGLTPPPVPRRKPRAPTS